MAIQMNIGQHTSPEPLFVAVPPKLRAMVDWARKRARIITKDVPGADRYYKSLPGGRTLTELLNDSEIWINYAPTLTISGATSIDFPKETAIAPKSFRIGRWYVLATLLHELAHVNGVDGTGHKAEEAVLRCGLGKMSEFTSGIDDPSTPYRPNVVG